MNPVVMERVTVISRSRICHPALQDSTGLFYYSIDIPPLTGLSRLERVNNRVESGDSTNTHCVEAV